VGQGRHKGEGGKWFTLARSIDHFTPSFPWSTENVFGLTKISSCPMKDFEVQYFLLMYYNVYVEEEVTLS
jgi:hypothetical protein